MTKLGIIAGIVVMAGLAAGAAAAPITGDFLAPPGQIVVIKAGKLYEPKSGQLLTNQVIIIHGDRIADVGANLAVPQGAKVIDLGAVTVMPGMVDAHVHANDDHEPDLTQAQRAIWGLSNLQHDLNAGFTTVMDVDDRGGFNTVDLRDMINAGIVAGPRMQVAGQSLNWRGANYVRDPGLTHFYSGTTQDKDVNSPWRLRAAVREAHNHGVDYIKIYATDDFVGEHYMWRDGKFQFFYSMTTEEAKAVVDEAHRFGLKVACHDYGGNAADPCLQAGVDAPQHLEVLDDDGIKMLKAAHSIYTPTIDDVIALEKGDLEGSGGVASRLSLLEVAVKKAKAAGIEMAFGSGSTTRPGSDIPHGAQANQFPVLVKWGFTPAEALRMTYITSPRDMNYNMDRQIGTIEKGKFADIIAVNGNPLQDISEMQRVHFVMKGGIVVRDDRNGIALHPVTPH